MSKRISLIHATPVSMPPIKKAFDDLWPEAELVNILEDSLSVDRSKTKELSTKLKTRISLLGSYAENLGSDAVLFACSAFGSAIEEISQNSHIPILKPNEAMFENAIKSGNNIAMLYTFEPAKKGMIDEFYETAQKLNPGAEITSIYVPKAIEALRLGDQETHNALVQDKVKELKDFDSIILAHFSTAAAYKAVQSVTSIPVFSSPESAVTKLQKLLCKERGLS